MSVLKTYKNADPSIRSGAFTSEFWLSVLVIIAATVLMLAGQLPAEDWKWAVGLVAGGYAISRGIAKT